MARRCRCPRAIQPSVQRSSRQNWREMRRAYLGLPSDEKADMQIKIETQYLALLEDLPISNLLDRLEKLHRFVQGGTPKL